MKMKVIFVVIILLSSSTSVIEMNTYFQKAGWISPSPSYGHVHMTINISLLETHIKTLLSTLNHLHAETMQHQRPQVKARGHNFLIQSISELKLVIQKFEDYQKMTNLPQIETKRAKRFLGIILALTSLSVGLYNTAEIHHLQASLSDVVTRQHHITDILQEHEVSIHHIAHNIDEMKLQMKRTIGVIEDIDAKQAFMEMEIEVTKAMAEVHEMVNCIIKGTERLLMHRLPLCFTNASNLEVAHKRLTHDAIKRNLTPIQPHLAAYLEYETSFIIKHKTLHIFVHVPLSDESQQLELLKFFSIPIQISPTLHMQIDVQQKFLAINRGGLHTPIENSEIEKCLKYNEIHFCEKPIILHKQLRDTCLGSIYMQNYTNLREKCPAIFFEMEESIEVFSSNIFTIYTATPQTIRITCKEGANQQHVAIKSHQQIKVEKGCKVSTNKFEFESGFDIAVDDEIQRWPTIWNLSDVLFDINAATLQDVIKRLNMIDSRPMQIKDIKKMVWMDTHNKTNFGILISIIVISILLIAFMIFICYRAYKVRQQNVQQRDNEPNNQI